jgi:hypothetical protein
VKGGEAKTLELGFPVAIIAGGGRDTWGNWTELLSNPA